MTTYHMLARNFGKLKSVAAMLLEIENRAQSVGWGVMLPTIFRLDEDDGDGYKLSPYVFQGEFGDNFSDEFNTLISMLRTAIPKLLIQSHYPQPPIAHMFISEAWCNTDEFVELLPELKRTGRDLSDLPGSEEARFGIAVCGDDYVVTVRKRSNDGDVDIVTSQDGIVIGGGLMTRLQTLHTLERNAYADVVDATVSAFAEQLDAHIKAIIESKAAKDE